MWKGDIQLKMPQRLSKPIQTKLESFLENVGDMSLKRRARRIIEEISPIDGDKIVDLGCGDGYYLYLLENLPVNLKLSGLDIDEKALTNARKNLQRKTWHWHQNTP